MIYPLKNGTSVTIRKPTTQDAQAVVSIISAADAEALFLTRNPGEFCTTAEREEAIIEGVLADEDSTWFVAEYEDRLVGQCSVGLVRRYQRYRYRAEVAFVVLKDYQGLGIGGKMMKECIALYGRNICGRNICGRI